MSSLREPRRALRPTLQGPTLHGQLQASDPALRARATDAVSALWGNYTRKFGKTYSSPEETRCTQLHIPQRPGQRAGSARERLVVA